MTSKLRTVVDELTTPQSLKFPLLDRELMTSRNHPNTSTDPNIPKSAAIKWATDASRPAIVKTRPLKQRNTASTATGVTGGREFFRLDDEGRPGEALPRCFVTCGVVPPGNRRRGAPGLTPRGGVLEAGIPEIVLRDRLTIPNGWCSRDWASLSSTL